MTYPHGGAAQIWRDLQDGLAHNPDKAEIRDYLGAVEAAAGYQERTSGNMAAAGALDDGARFTMAGLKYKRDDTVILADSCFASEGVAGVKPDGFCVQPEHYGGTDAPSVKKAADFVADRGIGEVYLPGATYDSPYGGTYSGNPVIMDRDGVRFRGGGRPSINSDATALEGGTRIRGSFFFAANRVAFHDLGIDAGEEFVGGSEGTPIEGLIGIDRGAANTAGYSSGNPDPYKKGCEIRNVTVLCKGTHKGGNEGSDISNVHAFLLENYDGYDVNGLITCKGGAGQVIKSTNGKLRNSVAMGHFKYTYLWKSELYSSASNNIGDNLISLSLGVANPTPGTDTDYDTGGLWLMAANDDLENVLITNFLGFGLEQGIDIFANPGKVLRNCHVRGVGLTKTNNYVTLVRSIQASYDAGDPETYGQVIDCSVTEISSHESSLGINIQNPDILRFKLNYSVSEVNNNALTNSGTNTLVVDSKSIDPTFAHISPDGGDVTISGEFQALGGNALVASSKPGDVYFDPMQRHTSETGHVGAIMGPTSGAMDVDDYSELAFRVRNTLGGAVAADGIGASIRAVQTKTGSNSAGLYLAVLTTGGMREAVKISDRGDVELFVHATEPTLAENQYAALWAESNTTLGIKYRAPNGDQRKVILATTAA